jgi:ditrans,polycis-polyprenyl diphosphate synthase
MGIFVKPLDFLGFHVVHRTINDTIKAFTTNIFKTGILPKHVAFIMDGNRRFAKSNGLDKFEGHEAGSVSLAKIIETSYLLRIKYVTIYAFSIENFNRTKEEVDKLFELLVEKLNLILESEKKFERNKSAQVRIIGNRSFIPSETLEKLEQIERLTKSNDE